MRGKGQRARSARSGGAASRRPGIHQVVKGLNIQAMTPMGPIALPQALQALDHGTLPRGPIAGARISGIESAATPHRRRVRGYPSDMFDQWRNHGNSMKGGQEP